MLPEHITSIINQIAKDEGFSEFKIETTAGTKHGDNFMGELSAITISGTKGTGKTEELQLVCKIPSQSEIRRKNFQSKLLFTRELSVYSKIFPDLIRFQQEKGLSESDSFLTFPKMFACEIDQENDKYILIMEDLRAQQFEMWPKENLLPIEHELLVLRELGKLHGVSFALKDQRPEQFEAYKPQLKDNYATLCIRGKFRNFSNKSIERAAKALKNPEHKKLMENFRQTYAKTIEEILLGESSQEFGVIGHGDLWNNNLLFQYADSEKKQVKAVKFVDWQITRYCPTVLDLYFNIFSATDKAYRAKYYDKMLQSYYSSLSETVRKLGSDPDKLYSWEDFQNELRKFGQFALWCGPLIIQLNVATDIMDTDTYAEAIEHDCDGVDLFNPFDTETQAKYDTLINDFVDDLIDYGYIQI